MPQPVLTNLQALVTNENTADSLRRPNFFRRNWDAFRAAFQNSLIGRGLIFMYRHPVGFPVLVASGGVMIYGGIVLGVYVVNHPGPSAAAVWSAGNAVQRVNIQQGGSFSTGVLTTFDNLFQNEVDFSDYTPFFGQLLNFLRFHINR